MPSGFFGTSAGTMLRTNFPFASYSLMIGGKIAPATYQCECGARTIETGMLRPPSPPPLSQVRLPGGFVTRCSALAQAAALDGNGGENTVTFDACGSGM